MNKVFSNKMRRMSFFCAIFIAVMHLSQAYLPELLPIVGYWQKVGEPAMVFFFFSSAYFRFRNYKQEDYFKKLKKRIVTLLIPYLCWNVISYFVCVYKGFYTFSPVNFVKLMIFAYIPIRDVVHESALGISWFIIRLLTYELLAPLWYWIIKNKKVFYPVVVVLSLTLTFGNINYYAFPYWVPIYMVGAFVAYNYSEKIERMLSRHSRDNDGKLSIVCTALAVAIYFVYSYLLLIMPIPLYATKLLALPVVLFCLYLYSEREKVPGWLVTHGSFFLYCIHVPLKWLFAAGLTRFFGERYGVFAAAHIYMFLIIVMAFAIEWVIYKVCPVLLKILTGDR